MQRAAALRRGRSQSYLLLGMLSSSSFDAGYRSRRFESHRLSPSARLFRPRALIRSQVVIYGIDPQQQQQQEANSKCQVKMPMTWKTWRTRSVRVRACPEEEPNKIAEVKTWKTKKTRSSRVRATAQRYPELEKLKEPVRVNRIPTDGDTAANSMITLERQYGRDRVTLRFYCSIGRTTGVYRTLRQKVPNK
ncbi:hypothetical protein AXG93_4027s1030 [Marchantia polymorpha subsp. ruderalis]|uniref:Uncharacterized protein n=1 Tax=Marchantia polymorpha subsp. ruderalis TaxID=1480154 RepID=A0A176W6Z3_MARPO|nr:hypothetical protein AXG93_4027s1030 [Marchantia polymorpha subsp. ruderalis]